MLFLNGLGFSGSAKNEVYSSPDEMIFSVKDTPYNRSFTYWVEKWFDWFLSFPISPREDYSSTLCSQNQNNNHEVWMLVDGDDLPTNKSQGEIRDCKVPAGKALLVQIVGSNCSTDEGYNTDDELYDCAQWILNDTSLQFHASIDGIQVMNTEKNPDDKEKYYVKPFFTNLTYPSDNKYGANPGTFRGTEAGYFLFVKPLAVGNHTIFYDEYVKKRAPDGEYDQRISKVTYNLQIVNMTK